MTNSLLFGVLSLLLINYLHPFIAYLLNVIPKNLLILVTSCMVILFFIDLLKSIRAILSINTNLNEINNILVQLNRYNVDFKSLLKDEENYNKSMDIKVLTDKLKMKLKAGEREKNILKAFPKAKHKNHNDIFRKFKNLNK